MILETHGDGAIFHIHLLYGSDVSIEYILVVIISNLHYAVAQFVGDSATADSQIGCVECLLQQHVQIGCTYHAFLHRGKHLDVTRWLIVSFWQTVFYKIHDFRSHLLWIFILDKEEIGLFAVARVRIISLVDGVGTYDDSARLRLSKDAGESEDRNLL